MRTLIIAITFTLLNSISFSQSHTFGTFNFSAGYDAGFHGVLYNSTYNNGTFEIKQDEDTSAAVTSMFRFDGHINLLKFLSVGLNYRRGKYIEDEENTAAQGNKVSMIALAARLYPVNKDNFVWYLGGSFGLSNLTLNREFDIFTSTIPYQYKFRSPQVGFETGLNWYFAGGFGLNFGLGYTSQNLVMKEFSIDGENQDLSNYENILSSKGVHANIGLTFHLGGD